jgi:DnaA-homolog protein
MKQIALDIGLPSGPRLSNYLAGPNNEALQHLRMCVEGGSRSPVPTYLWGPEGCGRTHLLSAVRRQLAERGVPTGWMDADSREPDGFDPRWQVVVMDDVHLYGVDQQHQAFRWFVEALSTDVGPTRWVLAAGDQPPAHLPLREDLRTRLGWGHVMALRVLGESERRAVLRQQADERGVFLSDDVMNFMLSRFSRDLGSLLELLDRLDAFSLRTQRVVTIPLIKSMLESE